MTFKLLLVAAANALIAYIICLVLGSFLPIIGSYAGLIALLVFILSLLGAIPLWWE